MERINVENHTLNVYHRNLFDSIYVVYENKIWNIVSKEKAGINFTLGLERKLNKEKIYVKGENLKNILYVQSKGYIPV